MNSEPPAVPDPNAVQHDPNAAQHYPNAAQNDQNNLIRLDPNAVIVDNNGNRLVLVPSRKAMEQIAKGAVVPVATLTQQL